MPMNDSFDVYAEFKKKQTQLADMMNKASALLSELNMASYQKKLQILSDKVNSDTFKVMVLGNFNNGKSTFINALLGEAILPAYNLPCTAVIHEVKYAGEKYAIVHFKPYIPDLLPETLPINTLAYIDSYDRKNVPPLRIPYDQIRDYAVIPMSENMEQYKNEVYEKIELFYPLELLKNGVEIIDSPGMNEDDSRTEITMKYLPGADAVVVIFTALQACTADEIRFVENELRINGAEDIFFVLNRFDMLSNDKGRERMKKYFHLNMEKLTKLGAKGLFCTSAYLALCGKEEGDKAKFGASGVAAFEIALADYLTQNTGKQKLANPARELKWALNEEAMFRVIPEQKAMLHQSVDHLKEKYVAAEPECRRLKHRCKQIEVRLHRLSQEAAQGMRPVFSNYLDLLYESIPVWVKACPIETNLSVGHLLSKDKATQKVNEIQEEITKYVKGKMEEVTAGWNHDTLKPSIEQETAKILNAIEDDLKELYVELDKFSTDISGITPYAVSSDGKSGEAKHPDVWTRIRAGVSGFFVSGRVGGALLSSATGTVGKEIAATLCIELGLGLLLGVLGMTVLPFMVIASIVTGISGMSLAASKVDDKIKASMIQSVQDQIRESKDQSVNDSTDKILGKFEEISQFILTSIMVEVDEKDKQIRNIIQEMSQGQQSANEQLLRISRCEQDIKALSGQLDQFLFSLIDT